MGHRLPGDLVKAGMFEDAATNGLINDEVAGTGLVSVCRII